MRNHLLQIYRVIKQAHIIRNLSKHGPKYSGLTSACILSNIFERSVLVCSIEHAEGEGAQMHVTGI